MLPSPSNHVFRGLESSPSFWVIPIFRADTVIPRVRGDRFRPHTGPIRYTTLLFKDFGPAFEVLFFPRTRPESASSALLARFCSAPWYISFPVPASQDIIPDLGPNRLDRATAARLPRPTPYLRFSSHQPRHFPGGNDLNLGDGPQQGRTYPNAAPYIILMVITTTPPSPNININNR